MKHPDFRLPDKEGRIMTTMEQAVIAAAKRWVRRGTQANARILREVVEELLVSTQPLRAPAPNPCGKFATNSATMSCILPAGHDEDPAFLAEMKRDRPGWSAKEHMGYVGGNPDKGVRAFWYSAYHDSAETHERGACARFPGCERHP